MPKQLGKGIDKEAMFKKIMPSASNSIDTAAAFNPDADGFSVLPAHQASIADSLDLDGDFGSLDMLGGLGSFDALDSFDLFDEPAAPRNPAPKKAAPQKAAKSPATKPVGKSSAKNAPRNAAAQAPLASNTPQTSHAPQAREKSKLPFPINTTATMAAPSAPTSPQPFDPANLPELLSAQAAFEPQPSQDLHLPFPINTTAPIAAPAAPNAPVPPPAAQAFDPIQLQSIPQPGLPAQQPPSLSQPMIPQEIMAQAQQQMMQQMQQMQMQMQQQMEQQMRQQMEQQLQMQQQMAQHLATPSPPPALPQSDMALPQSDTTQPLPKMAVQPLDLQPVVETTAEVVVEASSVEQPELKDDPSALDPSALLPVNLSAMLLNPRLEDVIERMHACKCEKCKTDTAAFALNQLPVRYTLSGQVSEEDLHSRVAVSQVVSALCHAVLFVKSHPRH